MEQEIEKLNARLEKAANAYKDVKAQLDAANAQIVELKAELESNNPNQPIVDTAELESLRQKVKDYEDELAINGNASEEIAKLNERLNKAKEIFTEQKSTIADLRGNLESEKENREDVENHNKLLGEDLTKTKETLNQTQTDLENCSNAYQELLERLEQIAQLTKV